MRIDAHHHLWQIGRNDQSWPTPDLTEICRDFGTDDLRAVASACGISGTVLVQSQPSETDTLWMLALARAEPLILGVVGWTDFLSPKAPERITWLTNQPKLKGLRPMLQGLDDDWILQDAAQPALKLMAERGLTFDALVYTRHLPAITKIAQAYPDLAIIIDHGAKPPIAAADPGQTQAWRDAIARAGQQPNIACKLSGLLTEAGPDQSSDALTPYADHLLAVFGPERLMWGSDWPVVLLKDSYNAWLDWSLTWLGDKNSAVRRAVMGANAARLYDLKDVPAHA